MIAALNAIAQLLASRLVDCLAWGTLIFLISLLRLRLVRQGASTRFALCFASLMAIAALPFIASVWRMRDATGAAGTAAAAITLPDRWALYLCAAWALIAGWFVLNVGRSLWHLRAVRRESVAVDASTLPLLLRNTLEEQRGHRPITLRISDRVHVPTAIGFLRPAILVPRWVMDELSTAELNQIFLHELAHLQRWDDWTNLAQQLVRAVFFFHPAVWWIENRITLEREMACDDAVLAATASPRAYAECLAHLAERSFAHRTLALAHAALGRVRQISIRVAEILDGNRPAAKTNAWKPAVALVCAIAVTCGVWSSTVPRLIAFQDQTPVASAHSLAESSFGVATPEPLRNHLGGDRVTQNVPATYAKLSDNSLLRPATDQSKVALNPHSRRPQVSVKTTTMIPVTETLFVVIEGGQSPDMHVYQIQMFRVTILRQSIAPAGSPIPQREI